MGSWGFEGKIGEPEITRLGCVCWLLAQHLSRQKSELTITLGDAYIFLPGTNFLVMDQKRNPES